MTKRGRGWAKSKVPPSPENHTKPEVQGEKPSTKTKSDDDVFNNNEKSKIERSETLTEDVKSMPKEQKLYMDVLSDNWDLQKN
ncbi:unnamed protein product [Lathyrus sativus]|nr:unnamed protein product [Lathyrus sativus]